MNLDTAIELYPEYRAEMKRRLLRALSAELNAPPVAVSGLLQMLSILSKEPEDRALDASSDEYIRLITRLDDCLEPAADLWNRITYAEPGSLHDLLCGHTEITEENVGEILERVEGYVFDAENPERDNAIRESWIQQLDAAALLFVGIA